MTPLEIEIEGNLEFEVWCLCFLVTFLLGSVAAVLSKTIAAPFERIKIIQQCNYEEQTIHFKAMTHTMTHNDEKSEFGQNLTTPKTHRPLTSSFSERLFIEIDTDSDTSSSSSIDNQTKVLSGGILEVMNYIYRNQGPFLINIT